MQKLMTSVITGAYSRFTSVISQPIVSPMSGRIVAEAKVKNRVSGHEKKTGRVERAVHKENGVFTKKGRRGGKLVTRCGRETCKMYVAHAHNVVKWGNTCEELRNMYMKCLSLQVDIACGDGNQVWYFSLQDP